MKRILHLGWIGAAILVALGAVPVAAQQAATVIAVAGTVEIGRDAKWRPAAVGDVVEVGDQLRTGQPGRVSLAFRDQSTIVLSDGSLFTVDESTFAPKEGAIKSYMRLIEGKVRALVSQYYKDPLSTFQIETATAVSGVRGTDFVVLYDARAKTTEVVGVTGRIQVHSVLDRSGRGVLVGAGQASRVAHGGFPTTPRSVAQDEMHRFLDGVQLGAGAATLLDGDPILQHGQVPAADGTESAGTDGTPMPIAPPAGGAGDNGGRSSPSGVADQPAAAIGDTGRVAVPF
jgi:hypothetical protein